MACPCPCCGKTGACCADGACTQETCADCEAAGGLWQGYDVACDGVDCPCDPPADHTLCEKCLDGVVVSKCESGYCCDGVCQAEPCESVSGLSLFSVQDCSGLIAQAFPPFAGTGITQVWRKALGHCGIGDCLRGALEIQRLTGALQNDYSGHPVEEFVVPGVQVPKEVGDAAPLVLIHAGDQPCLVPIAERWRASGDPCVMFSNAGPAWYRPLTFSRADRACLASMLIPNASAELDLLNERYRMPLAYEAYQFRTDDNRPPDQGLIDVCIAQVPDRTDVWVLASSSVLRDAIKAARPNVFVFEADVAHTGKDSGPGIKQSLLEFWLLGMAKKLHAFSVYEWISNYAVFAAARTRVPIVGTFIKRHGGRWYAANGPGTHLKGLLARIGIQAKPNCSCAKRAAEMDINGPQWCEANIDTISGWLSAEASKRGLPYVHAVGKALVRLAIRRCS